MSAVVSPVPASLEATSQAEVFDAVARLQELLAQQQQLSAETAELVRDLAARCESRFEREEASPWYTGISETAPWLISRVDKLSAEHQRLRNRLTNLNRTAERQLPLSKPLQRLAAQLNEFRDRLVAHEKGEVDLCFQVYMTDVGSKD